MAVFGGLPTRAQLPFKGLSRTFAEGYSAPRAQGGRLIPPKIVSGQNWSRPAAGTPTLRSQVLVGFRPGLMFRKAAFISPPIMVLKERHRPHSSQSHDSPASLDRKS